MVEMVASLLLGSTISIGISWWFANRSSKELRQVADEITAQTAQLEHQNWLMLSAMEAAGMITLVRGEDGRIKGALHTGFIEAVAQQATVTAVGEVQQPPENTSPTSD